MAFSIPGVGGLTVLDAMRRLMPGEDYLFLGDTARVPYGAKSQKTIVRYSLQAAAKLIGQRIKLLVIACNTATAAALPALRETWPDMPIIGVIEPVPAPPAKPRPPATSRSSPPNPPSAAGPMPKPSSAAAPKRRSAASPAPCSCRWPKKAGSTAPSPKAWFHATLSRCLRSLPRPTALCSAARTIPCSPPPSVRSSGRKSISWIPRRPRPEVVKRRLADKGLAHPQAGRTGRIRFFITDDPQRFTRTGSLFLNMTITDSDVRLVDLENVPLPDAAETPTQRKSS